LPLPEPRTGFSPRKWSRTGVLLDRHLPLDRLEENFVVQRCGLTPTDLLHINGQFQRWDTPAANRFFHLFATLCQKEAGDLLDELLETVSRKLALEILKRQLDDEVNPEALHNCPVCQALMNNVFNGGNSHYQVRIDFKRPVVGIGAPIAFFLPRAAAMIGAQAVLPEHADVANAIGAITSNVVVERQVRIIPGGDSGFLIEGLSGARRFNAIEAADAFAKSELWAGTPAPTPPTSPSKPKTSSPKMPPASRSLSAGFSRRGSSARPTGSSPMHRRP
jgi:N-methylhydantoinase A/oxoprolinase/acetone carboxylase beta subunit